MVTALTLLVRCWLIIALLVGYIALLIHIGSDLAAGIDFDTGIILKAARLLLLLLG